MNIESAIAEGVNMLNSKHIQNSKLDTENLMAKAIGEDRKYIILNEHGFKIRKSNKRMDRL